MISINDIYWAAGFLEGEGCFSTSINKRSKSGYYSLTIAAAQVQKEPLERLYAIFGGVITVHSEAVGSWSKSWKWSVFGRHAFGLGMTLWPLMSPKRQAQIMLQIARWKGNRSPQEMGIAQRGEGNPCARLTTEQVREIMANPLVSPTAFGKLFGVSKRTVWNIRNGVTWRSVTGFIGT